MVGACEACMELSVRGEAVAGEEGGSLHGTQCEGGGSSGGGGQHGTQCEGGGSSGGASMELSARGEAVAGGGPAWDSV